MCGLTALDRAFDLRESRSIDAGHTVRVFRVLRDLFQQLFLGCSLGRERAIDPHILAANSDGHDVPPSKSQRSATVIPIAVKDQWHRREDDQLDAPNIVGANCVR